MDISDKEDRFLDQSIEDQALTDRIPLEKGPIELPSSPLLSNLVSKPVEGSKLSDGPSELSKVVKRYKVVSGKGFLDEIKEPLGSEEK